MASGLPVLPDSRLQVRVAWLPSITVWSTPAVACCGGSTNNHRLEKQYISLSPKLINHNIMPELKLYNYSRFMKKCL